MYGQMMIFPDELGFVQLNKPFFDHKSLFVVKTNTDFFRRINDLFGRIWICSVKFVICSDESVICSNQF